MASRREGALLPGAGQVSDGRADRGGLLAAARHPATAFRGTRIIDCLLVLYSQPICSHWRRSAVSHQPAGGKSVPGHHHGRCRLDRSAEKSFWLLTSRPAVQDGPRSAWHDQGSAARPPPFAAGARICACANAHRNHCRCNHRSERCGDHRGARRHRQRCHWTDPDSNHDGGRRLRRGCAASRCLSDFRRSHGVQTPATRGERRSRNHYNCRHDARARRDDRERHGGGNRAADSARSQPGRWCGDAGSDRTIAAQRPQFPRAGEIGAGRDQSGQAARRSRVRGARSAAACRRSRASARLG